MKDKLTHKIINSQDRTCPICFSNQGHYLTIGNHIKILRCNQCSMVFADVNETTVEKACKYEGEKILTYYQNEPIYTIAYYDMVIEKIIKVFEKTNLKILEFGCGSGMFLRRARKKGLITQGVDFSKYSSYASKAFNLDILNLDIYACHFPSNHFDVIYSHATFEHLYAPLKVSEELIRILKPGGLFIISGVPNYNTLSIQLFHNFHNNYPPGHINYFECKTITYMYNVLGLKKIQVSTYGFNIWFLLHLLKIGTTAIHLRSNKLLRCILGTQRHDSSKREQNPQVKLETENKNKSEHIKENEEMKEVIYKLRHNVKDLDNISISFYQKLVANIYYTIRLPRMGLAVSAWGFKPKS